MRDSFSAFATMTAAGTAAISLFEVLIVGNMTAAFTVAVIGLVIVFLISGTSFLVWRHDPLEPPHKRPRPIHKL